MYESGANFFKKKMSEELDFSGIDLFMDIMCLLFLVLLCEGVFQSAIER